MVHVDGEAARTSVMEMRLGPLTFVHVEAGSTWVGTDQGGWIHAGQRPRFEARLPAFHIMEHRLTHAEVNAALGREANGQDGDYTGIDGVLLRQLCSVIAAHGGDGVDVRPPSLAEWTHAHNLGLITAPSGVLEVLADAPFSDHRHAPMDGRPRPHAHIGPLQDHLSCIEVHPTKAKVVATSSVPMDRRLPGTVLRLVVTPQRNAPSRTVPAEADRLANVRSELFSTLLIGVLPSFLIPVVRGFGSYALEGWANLLFGGLVVGFLSGAVWRPRRPSVPWEDGVIHDPSVERKDSQ